MSWIKFRKKYILPLKFWGTLKKERDGYKMKTTKEVQDKIKELRAYYLEAEKLDSYKDMAIAEAKLEILTWLINE